MRTVLPTRVRASPKRYGVGVAALGFVLLVVLRFWASPVGRTIAGRDDVGLIAFLGIPLFLGLLVAGIGLFLLEPDR